MNIRACTDGDLPLLAALNKQLIEDERHDNPMNVEQLAARMKAWIDSEYRAYLFETGGQVVGYALIRHTKQPLYLRHFFIGRDSRRKGYGKLAFAKLLETVGAEQIDIEVLHWNEAGYSFWKSLGFRERSVSMRWGE
ncbi:MAG: GNAT family N-acetyltransferase [Paenibacillaceae bacterium]|nr:GNAT family N-acetyltransferase [Paenibacillaceae bacterium]